MIRAAVRPEMFRWARECAGLAAHSTMSRQALDSERVRSGLKDILLGPAELYEALRGRGAGRSV